MFLEIAIVVPERRIERHLRVNEFLIGKRELACVVVTVQVVAQHEDETESTGLREVPEHQRCDFHLRVIPGSAVADGCEDHAGRQVRDRKKRQGGMRRMGFRLRNG